MAKKPTSRNGDNALDADDAALWDKIVSTTEPLTRGKNRTSATPEPREQSRAASESDARVPKAKKRPAPDKAADAPTAPTERVQPPPLGRFERKDAKQLSSGRIAVDARIDLHGMRQREAHTSLRRFLIDAQARGHRHVLVITGKGTQRGTGDTESFFEDAGDTPGVLRRAVPLWLNEPDLRGLVVSYTQAAPRHGGEGALYVRLRKVGR